MYRIKQYTFEQADRLGLHVEPSKIKGKKLDVYKDNKLIASIGDIQYFDYPTFVEMESNGIIPKGTANERRRLYYLRHTKNTLNEKLAKYLLW
jgi:hypothetical protein